MRFVSSTSSNENMLKPATDPNRETKARQRMAELKSLLVHLKSWTIDYSTLRV
jgi:hypothetical protein